MARLRKAASGEHCTLQIHPFCTGNDEETVLAHLPSSMKGIAIKSPDWWGAFACSACHDIMDGRRTVELPAGEIERCIFRGLFRTWQRHLETGLIVVS